MDEAAITDYILHTFAGVETAAAMGYTFFFYGSDHKVPFVTLATEDNEYDRASDLNRPAVYRLNIGVSRRTYRSLFGAPPPPPAVGGAVDTGHDFTTLDQLLPHPVYAPQCWVCVLNPGEETFQKVRPLLAEAYERAAGRQAKRKDKGET
jgi:hypothetical protein